METYIYQQIEIIPENHNQSHCRLALYINHILGYFPCPGIFCQQKANSITLFQTVCTSFHFWNVICLINVLFLYSVFYICVFSFCVCFLFTFVLLLLDLEKMRERSWSWAVGEDLGGVGGRG